MKTLKLIGLFFLFSAATQAQVSVNVNIGTPPPWGPVGYSEVRYYYLPDVQAYYDIHTNMFIYLGGGGVWIHRTYLPSRYQSYDLYGGYKVVMTGYHGDAPYTNYNEFKTKYVRGYHGEAQRTIGEKPSKANGHDNGKGAKVSNNKSDSHEGNKNAKEDHGHGHGDGNSNGNGNGNGKKK